MWLALGVLRWFLSIQNILYTHLFVADFIREKQAMDSQHVKGATRVDAQVETLRNKVSVPCAASWAWSLRHGNELYRMVEKITTAVHIEFDMSIKFQPTKRTCIKFPSLKPGSDRFRGHHSFQHWSLWWVSRCTTLGSCAVCAAHAIYPDIGCDLALSRP